MRHGTVMGLCAVLLMACGEDGLANGDSSTGGSETTSADDTMQASSGTNASTISSSSGGESSSPTDSGSSSAATSASESTTSGASDESSDITSGGIVDDCDSYAQDCPAGEKCNPWANDGGSTWNALGCFPVDADPASPGDACTVEGSAVSGMDTCDVGAMCWNVDDDTNIGTCIALCTGSIVDPVCAEAGTLCIIANDGVLNLCLPFCSPLVQDCDDGQACYPFAEAFSCLPDASDGADGQECLALFAEDRAPLGFANVGACMVP